MQLRLRAIIAIFLAAFFVVLTAAEADAQRRRRRRRRPPPPQETEQTEAPPAEGEGQAAGDGSEGAEGEGDGGETELPPAEFAGGDEEPEGADAAAEVTSEEPAEEPGEDLYADAEGPDLGPIREEFTAIMDELVQVRSRVAVLGRQLFRTRMRVVVQNRAGDDQSLARMVLKLDGAPIFQGEGGEVPEDGRQVFDGFAAPGPHVMTIEVEQRARADDEYRYELRDTYRFQVIRNRLIEVEIVLDDDSDIAEDFADDEEGEFDVRTRMRVATRALGDE